jgi:hypothetical protein
MRYLVGRSQVEAAQEALPSSDFAMALPMKTPRLWMGAGNEKEPHLSYRAVVLSYNPKNSPLEVPQGLRQEDW